MAHYLVTGWRVVAATAEMLLDAGHSVVGVDNLNADYDVRMKEYRLGKL
jgi:nucleoside-diphosphate-sugar epimerase